MVYFHCRTRIRIGNRIRTPSPMVTLYYAELFSTGSDSDSDPYLDGFLNGYCTHFRDGSPSQFYYMSTRGSVSESKPVEKFCIVQESVSVSKSESISGSGNNPLVADQSNPLEIHFL